VEEVEASRPKKRSFWSKVKNDSMESFKATSSSVCPSQRVFALCGGADDARIAG
jgi:hypothetical protein